MLPARRRAEPGRDARCRSGDRTGRRSHRLSRRGRGFGLGTRVPGRGPARAPSRRRRPCAVERRHPGLFSTVGIRVRDGRAFTTMTESHDDTRHDRVVELRADDVSRRIADREARAFLARRESPSRDRRRRRRREVFRLSGFEPLPGLRAAHAKQLGWVAHSWCARAAVTRHARRSGAESGWGTRSHAPLSDVRSLADSARRSIEIGGMRPCLLTILAGVALGLSASRLWRHQPRVRPQGAERWAFGWRSARAGHLYGLVLRHGLGLVAAGTPDRLRGRRGSPTDLVASLLFETRAADTPPGPAWSALVAAAATLACVIPARRAADADPPRRSAPIDGPNLGDL